MLQPSRSETLFCLVFGLEKKKVIQINE